MQQHGSLVPHRVATGSHSLGTDPGPATAVRPTSLALYGSQPRRSHRRELVRTAVASEGDVSGSTREARCRNAATMGRPGHCTSNALFAGTLFSGDVAGGSTRPRGHTAAFARCLVPQGAAHVYGCLGRRASALLEANGFLQVPSPGPWGKTPTNSTGVPGLCSVSCGLMAKVELSRHARSSGAIRSTGVFPV